MIEKSTMKKPEFHFPPVFKKLKRGGPAIIQPKDAGMIIAYAGIGQKSRVLECGSGSGFLTVVLGSVAHEVISYEIREEFLKLASENVKRAGLENVTFKHADILNGIEEKELDAIVLDMQYAEKSVSNAHAALKKDGFLVGYLPNIEQAKEFYRACEPLFSKAFMLENIVREFEVREFGVRPKHWGLTHSAYLVFAQK